MDTSSAIEPTPSKSVKRRGNSSNKKLITLPTTVTEVLHDAIESSVEMANAETYIMSNSGGGGGSSGSGSKGKGKKNVVSSATTIAKTMTHISAGPYLAMELRQNIILTLRCSLNDLLEPQNGPNMDIIPSDNILPLPLPYNSAINNVVIDDTTEMRADTEMQSQTNGGTEMVSEMKMEGIMAPTNAPAEVGILQRLKHLELKFHMNELPKQCATTRTTGAIGTSMAMPSAAVMSCFWCTCPFNGPTIYLPKYCFKETYNVYGHFCSPECAAGHLMNERNLDDSVRMERYYLLNYLYGKTLQYSQNIKPAPNPRYLLAKFGGNLTIDEYRKLSKSSTTILMTEKPLTRVLPEVLDDSGNYIVNRLEKNGTVGR